MPRKAIDLSGQRFGRLKVLGASGKKASNGSYVLNCECDCGMFCEVISHNLRKGNTNSCGCLNREVCSKRMKLMNAARYGNA